MVISCSARYCCLETQRTVSAGINISRTGVPIVQMLLMFSWCRGPERPLEPVGPNHHQCLTEPVEGQFSWRLRNVMSLCFGLKHLILRCWFVERSYSLSPLKAPACLCVPACRSYYTVKADISIFPCPQKTLHLKNHQPWNSPHFQETDKNTFIYKKKISIMTFSPKHLKAFFV